MAALPYRPTTTDKEHIMDIDEIANFLRYKATTAELDIARNALITGQRNKRAIRERDMLTTLRVGDRVQIDGTVKPRYLALRLGTVLSIKNSRAEVDFGGPIGKFKTGKIMTPLSLITKVGA